MTQIALPINVQPHEVLRKSSFGGSIELCMELAGLEPKAVAADLRLDKGQLSRWGNGQEGVCWPKLVALMDHCGNDAPVLWMAGQRNFDLHSMRRKESEIERQLRVAEEKNRALMETLAAVMKERH